MRYFVHGDTHGDFDGLLSFIEVMELGEDDCIIVLGDMGLFWRKDRKDSNSFIEFYEKNYKCNLWFIDGN